MKSGHILVDVNVWLGPWPFQYFHDDDAGKLSARLSAEGIAHAMVGSPEAAFNPDCMAVNRLLLKRLAGSAMLHPVPALDPTKGDWPDILSLARDIGAAAVRLFPGYHCYELSSPQALAAVEKIARDGRFALFVQLRMEDERTHHPLCKIPAVSVPSVLETARRFPGLKIVALCPYYHEATEIAKGPANVSFDISHVERLRTVASLVGDVPQERVLFGTHAPFLQSRAAVMKIEAPYVTEEVRRAIGQENAQAIVGSALRAPAARGKSVVRSKRAARGKHAARGKPARLPSRRRK